MIACIPTNGRSGQDDTVCDHFGSAPFFTLYNSENSEYQILGNDNSRHKHGTCHPLTQLTDFNIDCVVCNGMGRRAIDSLKSEGITVYVSHSQYVREVIEELTSGKLTEADPRQACHGHGHGHGRRDGSGRSMGGAERFGRGRQRSGE